MQYPLISEYLAAIREANDNLDKLSHLAPVLDNTVSCIVAAGVCRSRRLRHADLAVMQTVKINNDLSEEQKKNKGIDKPSRPVNAHLIRL